MRCRSGVIITHPKSVMPPLYTSDTLRFFCRKAASFNVLYHSQLELASLQ
jgi:hypothetical protein